MFPSGPWEGFWQQPGFGRQSMRGLELHFAAGRVTGRGSDVVGRFTFAGRYDERTGRVALVKRYLGRHAVDYAGDPDGEGCIVGSWAVGPGWSGPFLLRPRLPRPTGGEPIYEAVSPIRPRQPETEPEPALTGERRAPARRALPCDVPHSRISEG